MTMLEATEDLRGDLKNRLGIDAAMIRFVQGQPPNSPEVREYIERRIAAGNASAKAQKVIMQTLGTW
jgi:hypothetical protein